MNDDYDGYDEFLEDFDRWHQEVHEAIQRSIGALEKSLAEAASGILDDPEDYVDEYPEKPTIQAIEESGFDE